MNTCTKTVTPYNPSSGGTCTDWKKEGLTMTRECTYTVSGQTSKANFFLKLTSDEAHFQFLVTNSTVNGNLVSSSKVSRVGTSIGTDPTDADFALPGPCKEKKDTIVKPRELLAIEKQYSLFAMH